MDTRSEKLEGDTLQVKLRAQVMSYSSSLDVFDSDHSQNKCNRKSSLLLIVATVTSHLQVLHDARVTGAGELWGAVGVDGLGAMGGRRRDCDHGLGGRWLGG